MVLLPAREGAAETAEALRIVVFGPNFPQRAIEPELLIGTQIAVRTSIARDQRSIQGFFFKLPSDGEPVRVRYGDSQEGELGEPFSLARVRPLPKACEG
jgi:hypothetical protein